METKTINMNCINEIIAALDDRLKEINVEINDHAAKGIKLHNDKKTISEIIQTLQKAEVAKQTAKLFLK